MNMTPFFVPVVYEHAAQLIGKRPWEVSRDADLLVAAHTAAYQRYHHTPVVVGIDVYNVEAEAYGSVLGDAGGIAIPSVERFACADAGEILDLPAPDLRTDGRFPMILEAARRVQERCPTAEVRVPLSGPFSIASNLVGFEELLFGVATEPEAVRDAVMHLAHHQSAVIRAAREMGLGVIVFESAASPPLLSPTSFREIALPALRILADAHRALTGSGPLLVLGVDAVPILDDLVSLHPALLICPPETERTVFMDSLQAHPEIAVRINIPPIVFTPAGEERAIAEATIALSLAAGREKVSIGTGVLPYDADPEIVLRIQSFIEGHRR